MRLKRSPGNVGVRNDIRLQLYLNWSQSRVLLEGCGQRAAAKNDFDQSAGATEVEMKTKGGGGGGRGGNEWFSDAYDQSGQQRSEPQFRLIWGRNDFINN